MVDPTTVNTSLAVPIRGTDVGTWDLPVNGNFTSIDSMLGSVTTIAPTSASITLATSQALVNVIRLTGTLTATVGIILPGIYKSWIIDNQLTNSLSSFAAALISTSGLQIGLPPGANDVFCDAGANINYRNLGRVGEYWDYAGTTVPSWVTLCTKPPYLNCNGTVFSSATYPVLANLLGTTTLPDARGRFRATLNQTTGRLTSSQGGVDGNTILAAGSSQTLTIGTSNLPPYTPSGSISNTNITGHQVLIDGAAITSAGGAGVSFDWQNLPTLVVVSSQTFTGTAQGGVSNPLGTVPPTYIGGITMIRAA